MVAWLVFLAGCEVWPGPGSFGGSGLSSWTPVSRQDVGTVCLETDGALTTATVVAPDCLSSSCSRSVEGDCTIALDGSDILVTSLVMWEQDNGDVGCTDDCNEAAVSCELEGVLPDGTYTVRLGNGTQELTLPDDYGC